MATPSTPRRALAGDARDRAAAVLVRVECEGAFAAPALDAALDRAPALGAQERGLATELAYGVLRTAAALDARLARFATRPGSLAALDPYTRAVLRVAAYQVLALDRVPPRAAVHAAVEALRRDRSAGTAGFANALLRRLAAERPAALAADARVELALAALPARVTAAVAGVLGGPDDARAALRAAFARTPAIGLRANPARADRDALAGRLAAELPGAELAPGGASPLALLLRGGGDPTRAPAYAAGLFAVQEEGAQCVALAADVSPGARVLDACAGRGGKTGALAALLEGRGVLHAADLYPDKLARVADELARLGLAGPALAFATAAVDLTRGPGALAALAPAGGYDAVVVDAPCSGLGTIARRPDILHRVAPVAVASESDPVEPPPGARAPLPEVQRAILERVAPLVRAGGTLLYAVCTLTREEGPDLVRAFCAAHPAFVPAEASARVPERLRPAEVTLRPDRDGTDGFMIFRLRRARDAAG